MRSWGMGFFRGGRGIALDGYPVVSTHLHENRAKLLEKVLKTPPVLPAPSVLHLYRPCSSARLLPLLEAQRLCCAGALCCHL